MVIKIRYPNTVKLDELLMSLRILDITVLGFLIQWNHVTYIWVPFFVQFSVPFLAPSCVPFALSFVFPISFSFSFLFRFVLCFVFRVLLCFPICVLFCVSSWVPFCVCVYIPLCVPFWVQSCSILRSPFVFLFALPVFEFPLVPFSFYLLHSVLCSFLCSFWSPPISGICLYWPNAYSDQVSTKSAKQKCGN